VNNSIPKYCIVTTVLLWVITGTAAAQPVLSVAPVDTTVVVDTEFQIRIEVDAALAGLMGYDVTVAFDTSIVELIGVDEGSLPGSGGAETFFHWFGAGAPKDTVVVNGAVLGTTVDGPGVLFTITLKGLREGITPVSIVASHMRDNFNVVIPHATAGGIVRVEKPIAVRVTTWGEIKAIYR
jgi:hypothetical protein